MKLFFTIITFLGILVQYVQAQTVVEHKEVIVIEDTSYSKQLLFDLSKRFARTLSKFAKIEEADFEKGRVLIHDAIETRYKTGVGNLCYGLISYNLEIQVKEGKARLLTSDFRYEYDHTEASNFAVAFGGVPKNNQSQGQENVECPNWLVLTDSVTKENYPSMGLKSRYGIKFTQAVQAIVLPYGKELVNKYTGFIMQVKGKEGTDW